MLEMKTVTTVMVGITSSLPKRTEEDLLQTGNRGLALQRWARRKRSDAIRTTSPNTIA